MFVRSKATLQSEDVDTVEPKVHICITGLCTHVLLMHQGPIKATVITKKTINWISRLYFLLIKSVCEPASHQTINILFALEWSENCFFTISCLIEASDIDAVLNMIQSNVYQTELKRLQKVGQSVSNEGRGE